MSQPDEGWRIAINATEWVTVKDADEALKLGGRFAELVATIGVYKAECDRLVSDHAALAAENERLRKVGFRLAERLSWCGNDGDEPLIKEWQELTGTDVYKDEEGSDAK